LLHYSTSRLLRVISGHSSASETLGVTLAPWKHLITESTLVRRCHLGSIRDLLKHLWLFRCFVTTEDHLSSLQQHLEVTPTPSGTLGYLKPLETSFWPAEIQSFYQSIESLTATFPSDFETDNSFDLLPTF
jgi:hypothetical protein